MKTEYAIHVYLLMILFWVDMKIQADFYPA
jgi:hypothetical protein